MTVSLELYIAIVLGVVLNLAAAFGIFPGERDEKFERLAVGSAILGLAMPTATFLASCLS